MANHLIHRQILQLRYSNVAQAKADMNSWGERFQKIIQPAMEEVLEELDLPNQIIRINLLELDLGKIPSSLDAELLIQKVKEVLKTQMLKQIPELSKVKPKHSGIAEIHGTRDELQDLELLLFLLEHGRNPWWKSTFDQTGIRDLFQKLSREKNPALKSLLESKSLSANQFRRLLNHTQYMDLMSLGQWVFPEKAKNWETFINSLENSLPQDISSSASWKKSKRMLLAELIFAHKTQKSFALSSWIEEFVSPSQKVKIPIEKLAEPLIWGFRVDSSYAISSSILEKTWEKWIHSSFIQTHSEIGTYNSPKAFSHGLETLQKEFQKPANQQENSQVIPSTKDSRSSQQDLMLEETYPILNAGLVLVAPFLPYFFNGLGLLENKMFVSQEAQNRAALLLQCLLEKEEAFEESELLLNKLLCGISPGEIIPVEITLSEVEKEEIPNLLNAMVAQWTALKSTSGESMAKGFFSREGILKKVDRDYQLTIPRISIDILLNRLPWTLSIIKLPWMQETLFVEW